MTSLWQKTSENSQCIIILLKPSFLSRPPFIVLRLYFVCSVEYNWVGLILTKMVSLEQDQAQSPPAPRPHQQIVSRVLLFCYTNLIKPDATSWGGRSFYRTGPPLLAAAGSSVRPVLRVQPAPPSLHRPQSNNRLPRPPPCLSNVLSELLGSEYTFKVFIGKLSVHFWQLVYCQWLAEVSNLNV